MKALLTNLTERERALVRDTEPARMAELDEDELVELHQRTRRARNKYVTLYRREASAKVRSTGGRGKARPTNRRNAGKAEVFEDALARVSRRLAVVAKQSAAELRRERLDAALADKEQAREAKAAGKAAATKGGSKGKGGKGASGAAGTVGAPSAATRKRNASTLATGARRQATRDSR